MSARFDGAVALVTGAGSGIGRATALRLAAEGARVWCLDRDGAAAARAARAIEQAGGTAAAACADVRDEAAVRLAVGAAAERHGPVTLLVNAAGLMTPHTWEDVDDDAWALVLDVNLKGPLLVARAVAPAMARAGGGAIVNVTSVEADVVVASGGASQPHYLASKAALKTLTKALAHDLGPAIRVNCVAPGPVATGFSGADLDSPAIRDYLAANMVDPRPAAPAEVAAPICFLLSREASFITGVQLPVDGGWLVT